MPWKLFSKQPKSSRSGNSRFDFLKPLPVTVPEEEGRWSPPDYSSKKSHTGSISSSVREVCEDNKDPWTLLYPNRPISPLQLPPSRPPPRLATGKLDDQENAVDPGPVSLSTTAHSENDKESESFVIWSLPDYPEESPSTRSETDSMVAQPGGYRDRVDLSILTQQARPISPIRWLQTLQPPPVNLEVAGTSYPSSRPWCMMADLGHDDDYGDKKLMDLMHSETLDLSVEPSRAQSGVQRNKPKMPKMPKSLHQDLNTTQSVVEEAGPHEVDDGWTRPILESTTRRKIRKSAGPHEVHDGYNPSIQDSTTRRNIRESAGPHQVHDGLDLTGWI